MWSITYETAHLVSRYRGTLPVILTCPRDGQESPLGCQSARGQLPTAHHSGRAATVTPTRSRRA